MRIVTPGEYVAGLEGEQPVIGVLGAPGAIALNDTNSRVLAEEGVERAEVAAGLLHALRDRGGSLILHPGYGAGYQNGGGVPSTYVATEAFAYERAIGTDLRVAHGIEGIEATRWTVLPGAPHAGKFDPKDFSSSTLREAYLIDRTCRELGMTGILGLVGGPRQLLRFTEGAQAMQLTIADRIVGIRTSGRNENALREGIVRRVYRRGILPGEQTPEAVLAREDAFIAAGVVGKMKLITRGLVSSGRSPMPSAE